MNSSYKLFGENNFENWILSYAILKKYVSESVTFKKQVQGHDSESVLLQPSPKHNIFVISNFYLQNSHLKGYFVQIY